jgi:hypothetical protein
MKLQEIPHEHWREYLDMFSRAHRSWPARVQTTTPQIHEAHDLGDLPLLGITDEQSEDREQIQITLGHPRHTHLSHTIERPLRLCAAEWNDGYSGRVEIESADGETTTVQVGPKEQTLPPGMITDGVI